MRYSRVSFLKRIAIIGKSCKFYQDLLRMMVFLAWNDDYPIPKKIRKIHIE